MLRETDFADRRELKEDQSVWPVLQPERAAADPVPAVVDDALPFRPESSSSDVPAAVGGLMFAVYAALIGALWLATTGPGKSGFMIVIAVFFLLVFFAVPLIILRQEPSNGSRPALHRFLSEGLATHTGHCSGKAALIQILIVPALLMLGILAIALEIAFIF